MKSIRLFAALFVCLPLLLSAQNLVLNPSFEEVSSGKSITLNSDIEVAANWSAPNAGKSLLYTTKDGYVYDPNGASWPFKARTGKNVAGMNVYGESYLGEPRREYIQGTLARPLTVGRKYVFEFWVHYHCEGANNIGIVFLPNKIEDKSGGLLKFEPVAHQKDVTKYDNGKDTWTLVRGTFVAAKPFSNFIIGNFFPDSLTQIEDNGYGHHFAYIDDILVNETKDQPSAPISQAEIEKWDKNVVASKNLTAKGSNPSDAQKVYFEVASAEILPETAATLDKIAEQLTQKPNAKIELSGFASSEGSETYNKQLSKRRNQSVRKYLLSKGVASSNISLTAFGEKNPAESNDTEEGRSKNRRVEITWREE